MTNDADLSQISVLFPDHSGIIAICNDGEILRPLPHEAQKIARGGPVLICHHRWTQTKIDMEIERPLDVLELFAFIRPAQICLPTPEGLALKLGLASPVTAEDRAMLLSKATFRLLDELEMMTSKQQQHLAELAEMMRRGGWYWGPIILMRLGQNNAGSGPPDGQAGAVWKYMSEISEAPNRAPPGSLPVLPDEARARLSDMLGSHAEQRQSQSDYAAASSSIFASPDSSPTPIMLLSEAGTGTGKTLGYLAPASLWAEKNGGSVWVSTYTRSLQHQIADELSRLFPDRDKASKKIIVRKGRENYLCVLNLEEALSRMPAMPADAIGLGLIARWVSASPDGDLTGNNFPSWLVDLIGTRLTLGLSDRRGECIHSACPHYHKCFVEKSIRLARQADIVIANHALVMHQAAMMGDEDRYRPTRFIFDEGHHIFDAADSAFSAALTAMEAAELRHWIRGAEDGRRGRARGLEKRLIELLGQQDEALAALEAAVEAARILPGTGWRKRISENHPACSSEAFLSLIRLAVYARNPETGSAYNLQSSVQPVSDDLISAARKLKADLACLSEPLTRLSKFLQAMLDDKAEELDTQTRSRLEGALRGMTQRATGPLAAWQLMLSDLELECRDGFIDWMEVARNENGDYDVGLMRHWLDPMIPFAESVLLPADGVAVTSATLCDENAAKDPENLAEKNSADKWQSAYLLSGAGHLPHPALVSTHKSPFDYGKQARIFVVNDLNRERSEGIAAAMAALTKIVPGGTLGLFTSILRLKQVYPELQNRLAEANIPLYAQHIDKMSLQTLLQMFRQDVRSALIGTDAVRDGVDVPGPALQMMIYDRVPWPRPDMLFKARAKWQGQSLWTDRMTRMRLRQAFGRLIRRAEDRGVFVMLDSRLPTRLTSAFPPEIEIIRTGLADVISQSQIFLNEA